MIEAGFETLKQDWDRRVYDSRLPDYADATAEITRYFRENYPILLDGAQSEGSEQRHFVQQARETMSRGRAPGMMPAAILRETLDTIQAAPHASTRAGLTAVAPKAARVWWDSALLERPDDVLAGLESPRPILRFFDITGLDRSGERWHETFDIDVNFDDQGKTVQFWQADRTYMVDLGYLHADGRFVRLARTNTADLPRDCRGGDYAGQTARSNLRARATRDGVEIVPDARAKEWAEARADFAGRDVEAELVLHMIYRAFLSEGPRALRRMPGLLMRDEDVLQREYVKRCRTREKKKASARIRKKVAPAFLVAVLDPVRRTEVAGLTYYPAPVVETVAAPEIDVAGFAWFSQLLAVCRAGLRPAAERFVGQADLVAELSGSGDVEVTRGASPVFEAARSLRERMTEITLVETEPETAAGPVERKKSVRLRDFGGLESRRMAKAGVRITRMALTLEGRMRPGARLKVAGKLVYADAEGNFRLECVLTGRRASIPLRAGLSVGGEAASVINVDWEKRAGREKKALAH